MVCTKYLCEPDAQAGNAGGNSKSSLVIGSAREHKHEFRQSTRASYCALERTFFLDCLAHWKLWYMILDKLVDPALRDSSNKLDMGEGQRSREGGSN